MTNTLPSIEDEHPRDAGAWAKQGALFKVVRVPTGALNLNVEGREAFGPLQGFGQMWQKTFRVRLTGSAAQPAEVIKIWKQNFATFWPKGYRFFAPLTGIAPGEVALINMPIPGGIPLSTGVMVLYADDESFTFMTPQGHTFSGWITFSAYEEEQSTVAQVQILMRPDDIVYELGYRFLGAAKVEDKFWQHTLRSLATRFGSGEPVETCNVCIDPKWQWSRFWNIWHNSAIRTTFYKLTAPVRWIGRAFRR
ncbi:MAG TPA: hypothetical protein VJO32_09755 [Ktedonobacteraceae bacterium]|nr:hypothetical protein [Ktedonobacteraceae bacterium]